MIALLLVCCLSAPAEVSVDAGTISLGALIEFAAGDPRADVSLGNAPNPGLARRFFKQDLLSKLTAAGLPADDLQLPESVLVRRKSGSLDETAVTEAVREVFARQYPDAIVNIVSVDVPALQVATGPLDIVATLPSRVDPSNAVFVRLDIRGVGFTRNAFARTIVEIHRPQPVLVNAVAAHSPIRAEDVEWRVMPVGAVGPVVDSVDRLLGQAAKRNLQAGQILTADLFYAPVMVRRGESVTVKSTNGAVTISATMRAKGSAALGELVAVEHLTGTGSATARVIGPQLLEAIQGAK